MKITETLIKESIKELVDITHTIQKIYQELINSQLTNNLKDYEEYLSLLNSCIELEDKIYQRLPVNVNNYTRYTYLVKTEINIRNYSNTTQKLISTRIENHLATKQFINPFLSIDKTNFEVENILAILTQYNRDYYTLIIILLNEKITTFKSNYIREKYLKAKYQTIFTIKVFESLLLTNPTIPQLDAQERLTLFGHSPDLIRKNFDKKIELTALMAIDNIKTIKEQNFSNVFEEEIYFNLQLIDLKAALYLLDKNQITPFILKLQNNITIGELSHNIYLEKTLEMLKEVLTHPYSRPKTLIKS